MAGYEQLEVDTEAIRQAAATLDTFAVDLHAGAESAEIVPVGGEDPSAAAVTTLVGQRSGQAGDAVRQLSRIASVLADQLVRTAEGFERAEAGLVRPR